MMTATNGSTSCPKKTSPGFQPASEQQSYAVTGTGTPNLASGVYSDMGQTHGSQQTTNKLRSLQQSRQARRATRSEAYHGGFIPTEANSDAMSDSPVKKQPANKKMSFFNMDG